MARTSALLGCGLAPCAWTRPQPLRETALSARTLELTRFGASSLDMEVFAYVRVGDVNRFLEVQEDLLLRIMDIIERSGTGFAFPSSTMYLARDR